MDRREFIKNSVACLLFGGSLLESISESEAKSIKKREENTNKDLVEKVIKLTKKFGSKENFDKNTILFLYKVSFIGCTTGTEYTAIFETDKEDKVKGFSVSYITTDYKGTPLAKADFQEKFVDGVIEPNKEESAYSQGYMCSNVVGKVTKNGKVVCKDYDIIHKHYRSTLINFIEVSKDDRKHHQKKKDLKSQK